MTLHNPSHPGETIKDCLADSGLTATALAAELGMSRGTLHKLMAGRIRITARTALGLERIGWSNAAFWLRVQANYDLAQERRRQKVA